MSTHVYIHSTTNSFGRPIEELIKEWGYTPLLFTDTDNAWSLFSEDHPPEILFFEYSENFSEAIHFLQTIWDTRHEFPFFSIIFGTDSQRDKMKTMLSEGAHDFLTLPIEEDLLRAKLDVARQIVVDRRSLSESAQVMERYAKHVDRLAIDRARQLFHAERLSTLGTMSAGLAHEINNPLGYISTSLETAQIYWKQAIDTMDTIDLEETEGKETLDRVKDKLPKAFDRISTGLGRIDKLMKGLKHFAHSSKGERKLCNINNCIEVALEMSDTTVKYHAEVIKHLSPDLPKVQIEPQQIEQVLINLCVNAAHALEGSKEGKITISTSADAEFVEILVSDNGPGIPRSKLSTIWEPYYTTKEEGKGTGLGLAISKSLIRDNGGTISVENRAEGGAEFTIRLPFMEKPE